MLEVNKITLRKRRNQQIGITFYEEESGIPSGLIYSIEQGSLASLANLQQGQQIISINGQSVDTNDDIIQTIQNLAGSLTLELLNTVEVRFYDIFFLIFIFVHDQ